MTWSINMGDSWYDFYKLSISNKNHWLNFVIFCLFFVHGISCARWGRLRRSGAGLLVGTFGRAADELRVWIGGPWGPLTRWSHCQFDENCRFWWWIMVNCYVIYVKFPEGKRILQKNLTRYDIWVACFCWWFEVQGNKNISFGNQMWLAGKSLINVGFTGHLSIPHRTALKEPQMSMLIHAQRQSLPPDHYIIYALWLFNIAVGHVPFMDDLLVFTS